MRIGISYVSLGGAESNLRQEIAPHARVADVAEAGARAWDRELSTVRVDGGTPARRQAFYTALYHALMQPNLISDEDGRYWGMDQAVHRLARGQRAQYGNFSGWDQYRAQIQLLACCGPTSPATWRSRCWTSRIRTTASGTAGCTSARRPT
jgi:putative alpha-1,2-mannosidase